MMNRIRFDAVTLCETKTVYRWGIFFVLAVSVLTFPMASQGGALEQMPLDMRIAQDPATGARMAQAAILHQSPWSKVRTLITGSKLLGSSLTEDRPLWLRRLDNLLPNGEVQTNRLFAGLNNAATAAVSGQGEQAAGQAIESAMNFLLPSLGDVGPNWLKRIEVEWHLRENLQPEYYILTVQPLYESPDNTHTLFTQLSQRRYSMFAIDRDVSNIGVGYRQLFLNNTLLAGVNSFWDYEWQNYHQRGSIGGELRWFGFDFYGNSYLGLTNKRQESAGKFEDRSTGGTWN